MQRISIFFLAILVLISPIYGDEKELLKAQDVSKVMKQIMDQQDKKEISGVILKHAFRIYFEQFDPNRIYMLQSEVDPWANMPEAELVQIIQQYKKNDFSAFERLNSVIVKAIERARTNRELAFREPDRLFTENPKDFEETDAKIPFAKNEEQLLDNLRKNIRLFVQAEKRQIGAKQVLNHETETLAAYDQQMHIYENRYLFLDNDDLPLAADEKENIFILHVLKALASSLDAHTAFYNPNEAYEMKVRLEKEFEGIGVVLQPSTDGLVVISKLVKGGPADKSGKIKPNDKIIAIDGKKVSGMPFNQVLSMIRGKNGSFLTLAIERLVDSKPEVLNIQLKREPIAINDDRVKASYVNTENGIIGEIEIPAFYQSENGISTESDLRNAIKELQSKGNLRGLILDMRDNSGGFLSQAVKVVGMFITNGVVVTSKYFNGDEHIYRDMDSKTDYKGPLVLLTSKATASAAEIVAQALQDYGIALVVGDERTYGKGTIQSQTITGNKGSSYFKVTVGKYYTVSGKTPQLQGVLADIVVPSQFSKEKIGEEYLEYTLKPDKIKPEYKDDLKDINPSLKPWYARYYSPTLQHKKEYWREMLPALKQKSEERLSQNTNYQMFIKMLNEDNLSPREAKEVQAWEANWRARGQSDLQMDEAVNIISDMIHLQSHPESKTTGLEYAEKP